MAKAKRSRVSFLNWMITLLLCAIPGVNIITAICFLIFGKEPSKKTFAAAVLVWNILIAIACIVLLIVMPETLIALSTLMKVTAAALWAV